MAVERRTVTLEEIPFIIPVILDPGDEPVRQTSYVRAPPPPCGEADARVDERDASPELAGGG